MNNWRASLVLRSESILNVIHAIDNNSMQIALIVDESDYLLGTVTDGDIRRAILRGHSLENAITDIMNRSPIIANPAQDRREVLAIMRKRQINHIPIVNNDGYVVGLETIHSIVSPELRDNRVVLMAGGLGSRLRPLTDDCPKPLLKVGGKPVLETTIENLISYGLNKFTLTVNYKAEMLVEHFGDGSKWGVDIDYIFEEKRMGTAGALSLLKRNPEQSFIVMNGDLLTKVNIAGLLDYHESQDSVATMCVRDYEIQVPYGVINVMNERLVSIEEKPVYRHFVNAGIYVLNPQTLSIIPKNEFYDMTTFFEDLIKNNERTSIFPIREYWLDIGKMEDYERANGEFSKVFG
ncbi:nucleotidyltransferase family protein [Cohnella cholangitidis]|uniref:CBS domain-containing protein n=1 Tax=Cohnella cholangitidis TaxID=2598458 RepID=A0A7G5BXL6_9BACL|nr:nucleotidyltransferase family protein [Cohnella cholangitidis]QMV41700.1 CBS domain-containing protein [Cohnella cholangitidis]